MLKNNMARLLWGGAFLFLIAFSACNPDESVADSMSGIGAPIANLTFNPPSGTTFSGSQNVTISSPTLGVFIRYTTNGTEPSIINGNLYTGPINVVSTTTIKAIAFKSGLTNSPVAVASYTKQDIDYILTRPDVAYNGTSGNIEGSFQITNQGTINGSNDVTYTVCIDSEVGADFGCPAPSIVATGTIIGGLNAGISSSTINFSTTQVTGTHFVGILLTATDDGNTSNNTWTSGTITVP